MVLIASVTAFLEGRLRLRVNASKSAVAPVWERSFLAARELLGLGPGFTKAQLRAAWLRLARELHPDRRSSAGPAVRNRKEAGLKRVNAARDELAPVALRSPGGLGADAYG